MIIKLSSTERTVDRKLTKLLKTYNLFRGKLPNSNLKKVIKHENKISPSYNMLTETHLNSMALSNHNLLCMTINGKHFMN